MDSLMASLAALLLLGMGAQWLAWRLHLPGILLLLGFGFFAGPAWLGWIDTDRMLGDLLFPIVSASVAVILFEGGLSLRMEELRKHGKVVLKLITVGAVVTWVLSALAAHYVLGWNWSLSILFGAIIIVSGPTVVLPLLHHIKPQGAVRTILKWEGIAIDPVGALLALLVFEGLDGGALSATSHTVFGILKTLVFGTVTGLAGGGLLVVMLRRYWLPDHLHNPVTLALVVGVFAASNMMQHESGLLAVTLMGIVAANHRDVSVAHILEFKENLRTLLISSLFVLLAARVAPGDLALLDWRALVFMAVLVFVVRPLSVLASTRGAGLTWQERLFLSWMCPRGIVAAAVASVFGLRLVVEGNVPGAEQLLPMTFVVIVGTVLIYGLTAGPLARRLGLATPNPQGILFVGAHSWARAIAQACVDAGVTVLMVDTNRDNVKKARMAGLPAQEMDVLAEEHAFEELDISGIGRLFALTANDKINQLLAMRAIHEFGRSKTYVLTPDPMEAGETHSADTRVLFAPEADFYAISRRIGRGATVRTTGMTDQFGATEFQELHGELAIPLVAVSPSGQVSVSTVDRPVNPSSGDTLIALIETAAEDPGLRSLQE